MNIIICATISIILLILLIIVIKVNIYSYSSVVILTFLLPVSMETFLLLIGVNNYAVILYITSFCITVVGALIVASNVALVRHEGISIKRLLGIPVMVSGIVAGILARFYVVGSFLCLLQCSMLAYFIMSFIAVKKKPKLDKDFVIILGCLISKDGGLLPLLKQRTNRAIHFAWEQEIAGGHPVKYVPSGGQGKNEVISEGSAIEMYLLSHGAENYEVYPDKLSKNTYENMLFSKRIIDSQLENAKVAFATTNYHVFRSGLIAKQVGLNAEGISAKTKWYFWPAALVREYIAFMKMLWGLERFKRK